MDVELGCNRMVVPSKNVTMLSANATVIHLGRIETVKFGSNPIRRPTRAVEYNENKVEIMTEVKISAACLLTSCKIQARFQKKKY